MITSNLKTAEIKVLNYERFHYPCPMIQKRLYAGSCPKDGASSRQSKYHHYRESLKFGVNFLDYWTYRTKNDLQTEYTSVTCLLPNKNQVIVKSNPVVCQFSEYFLDLEGDA